MSHVGEVEEVFLRVLRTFCEGYGDAVYYTERDIVYVLQTRLVAALAQYDRGVQVFNDYKISPTARADLVVRSRTATQADSSLLAVEFKYEPDRDRTDIPQGKFPVTAWTEITKDRDRINLFASANRAEVSYCVLFDEDGRYDARAPTVFPTNLVLRREQGSQPNEPPAMCWFDRVGR